MFEECHLGPKGSILDCVIRLDLVSELGCNLGSDRVSDWIVYRIGNNFEEPHLGLKGSILDRVIRLDCNNGTWMQSLIGSCIGSDRLSDWIVYLFRSCIGSATILRNLTWDWKAPSWIVLSDWISYLNSDAISDRIVYQIGKRTSPGTERLRLGWFRSCYRRGRGWEGPRRTGNHRQSSVPAKFVYLKGWFKKGAGGHDLSMIIANILLYSLCLNCPNVCLCKSLSELQIFKLTRNGASVSLRHCLS